MPKFVRLEDFWYEYDDTTPLENAEIYNSVFGRSTEDITGCEIIELDSADDLDWRGTSIYDDKCECGWLSPDGKFYGCEYTQHSLQARILHGVSEFELEEKCFIKIRYDDASRKELTADVSINRQTRNWNIISPKQYQFLKSYPINNFQSIEFMYRQQIHNISEQQHSM